MAVQSSGAYVPSGVPSDAAPCRTDGGRPFENIGRIVTFIGMSPVVAAHAARVSEADDGRVHRRATWGNGSDNGSVGGGSRP